MIYKIKDNRGQDYKIQDIERFVKHIFKYHSNGSSLHEENGYYFTVDDKFRKKIVQFLEKRKK